MTTFADGVFQYGGQPVGALPFTGQAWFVKPNTGSDSYSGKKPNRAFATLSKALSASTADNGDVVYFIAESASAASCTDYLSAALDWNKDGVHLVGVNAGNALGQRSRIAPLVSVATIEDLFTVSADGCLIANILVYDGDVTASTATAPRAVVVSGERNHFVNCQFSLGGDAAGANSLDVAGARALSVTGGENLFENCYLGLDTLLKATQEAEVDLATGARNIFRKCMFATYTSNASMVLVSVAASVDRFAFFDECSFYAAANITSATAPNGAFNAVANNGLVLLKNPFIAGITDITAADNTYIKVLGFLGTTANANLTGLAQSVDAA